MKKVYSSVKVLMIILIACSSLLNVELSLAGTPVIKERNILANKAKEINLNQVLITDQRWNTLPSYGDRQFWQSLAPNVREEYISKAEKLLNYSWPAIKATDYLEIIRSGDRRQDVFATANNALVTLVMGELVEGKGRFLDQIINAVWFYSEQTWWGWSAHFNFQKAPKGLPDVNDPTVDLGVGEVSCNLAWTLQLFKKQFDQVHPLIAQRLKQEIMKKAVIPYYERSDFGYQGFKGGRVNNWNPWINYNMLNCALLLEEDPAKKRLEVMKIIQSMDKFLNGYSDDGGCDEGPSYWGAAGALLYEGLALLNNATNNQFTVYDNPLIQNIGSYFYKVNIHAPYFINFADADATTGGSPATVYRYGKAIHDAKMESFGAYLAHLGNMGDHSLSGKICDQLKNLSMVKELMNADAKEALVADFWLPDTEVAGARDQEDSYKGFFFGAKGGFNNESHNHNDVGSCVMYWDGKPCLIDLGREQYTARTFSSRRYEIWTMQSQYHNLPVINGIDQKDGEQFKASNCIFKADKAKAFFSTDIAGAYPKTAGVKSWVRSYTLNRGKNFIISDQFELSDLKEGVTSSNFITCCKVSEVSAGVLRLAGNGFNMNMNYNPKLVKPVIEFIKVTDPSLKKYWPDGVTRIKLDLLHPALKGGQQVVFSVAK